MRIVSLLVCGALLIGIGVGCASKPKCDLKRSTTDLLKAHRDIAISGKTGAVIGSDEDKAKAPNVKINPESGYPEGSLRNYMIVVLEEDLDPETMARLKSKEDVRLCGKTGAIVGTGMADKPSRRLNMKTGYPQDSLRDLTLRKVYYKDTNVK